MTKYKATGLFREVSKMLGMGHPHHQQQEP
jgi:hypothetical protein